MNQYSLTNKEYDDLHKIAASKRATKEMVETLKEKLKEDIILEDRWWNKMKKKYNLDVDNYQFAIDHEGRNIVGVPKPRQQSEQTQIKAVPKREPGIRKRESAPSGLISEAEREAMKAQLEENSTDEQ